VLKNLTIQDSKKRTIVTTPEAGIKISIHKLINKNKFIFTKIVAKDLEINLHLDDIGEYKKFLIDIGYLIKEGDDFKISTTIH